MGAVVAWVLVTRLVGSTSPQQPRVYFAEASVVFIADALAAGDPGHRWLAQLRNTQVLAEHESPIQAPVAAVLQRVLGPSIELPTFIGAFWGLLAVILAWRLGRVIERLRSASCSPRMSPSRRSSWRGRASEAFTSARRRPCCSRSGSAGSSAVAAGPSPRSCWARRLEQHVLLLRRAGRHGARFVASGSGWRARGVVAAASRGCWPRMAHRAVELHVLARAGEPRAVAVADGPGLRRYRGEVAAVDWIAASRRSYGRSAARALELFLARSAGRSSPAGSPDPRRWTERCCSRG